MVDRLAKMSVMGTTTRTAAGSPAVTEVVAPNVGLGSVEFAVLDLETAGLRPGRDGIVEAAVVRVTGDGREVGRWSTLVKPRHRHVGLSCLHGIHADDVVDAPVFRDVAGDLFKALNGAVLVCHNIRFDWRFVVRETLDSGLVPPDLLRVCSLRLARLPDSDGRRHESHRLGALCDAYGVPLPQPHRAAADAEATARLLPALLARVGWETMGDLLGRGSETGVVAGSVLGGELRPLRAVRARRWLRRAGDLLRPAA